MGAYTPGDDAEVGADALDFVLVEDEGTKFHNATAFLALKRVNFEYFFDASCQGARGFGRWFDFAERDSFRLRRCFFVGGASSGAVGAEVASGLLPGVRDMLL